MKHLIFNRWILCCIFFYIHIVCMNITTKDDTASDKQVLLSKFRLPTSFPTIMYIPFVQASNGELHHWRGRFCKDGYTMKDVLSLNSNIQCMGLVDRNEDNYRCFQFAMEMITGNSDICKKLVFPGTYRENIVLKHFFEQAPYPQNGDLIVFTTNTNYTHFAFALNRFWFLSKIGANPQVFKHLPFCLPLAYESTFFVLRLRLEYQNDKQKLVQDMYAEIEQITKKES